MANPVITVRGLRKSYGSFEAVRGIDIDVSRGEIFAFLGPNGAGKTTTVEILEGYRERSAGEVEVLGIDPSRAGPSWRARIGVVLQDYEGGGLLTVRESLEMYAGYYPAPRPVEETLRLTGLAEQRDRRASRLSGGQRRRLEMALALIGDPELLFLDEPTTGFDPAARRSAWDVIANLRQLDKTVFLTTHYMEEAEVLADRVAIIAGGRIMAQGRPNELAGLHQRPTTIRFGLPRGTGAHQLPAGIGARARKHDGRVELHSDQPVPDLAELCSWAVRTGIDLVGLEAVRPTLEDVYLELTARPEAQAGEGEPSAPRA